MIELYLSELEQSLEEMVGDIAYGKSKLTGKEFFKEYLKKARLIKLYNECIKLNCEEFSWEKLHNEGMLCKNDYKNYNTGIK